MADETKRIETKKYRDLDQKIIKESESESSSSDYFSDSEF